MYTNSNIQDLDTCSEDYVDYGSSKKPLEPLEDNVTLSHANTRTAQPAGQLDSLRSHLMYITSGYTVCPKRMTNEYKVYHL